MHGYPSNAGPRLCNLIINEMKIISGETTREYCATDHHVSEPPQPIRATSLVHVRSIEIAQRRSIRSHFHLRGDHLGSWVGFREISELLRCMSIESVVNAADIALFRNGPQEAVNKVAEMPCEFLLLGNLIGLGCG
jgi:hypothetical protein